MLETFFERRANSTKTSPVQTNFGKSSRVWLVLGKRQQFCTFTTFVRARHVARQHFSENVVYLILGDTTRDEA